MRLRLLFIILFISIQVYSQKLDALIHKADSTLDKGNVTVALQLYSKAIKIDTNNAYLYIRRGMCFKYLDDNKSAITDLTKGLNKSTLLENKLWAYKERGKAFRNSRNYILALGDFALSGFYETGNEIDDDLINDCFNNIEAKIDSKNNEGTDSCYRYLTFLINYSDSIINKKDLYLFRSILRETNFSLIEKNSDLDFFKFEFNKISNNDTLLEQTYLYNYRKSYNYFELDSIKLAFNYIDKCIALSPNFDFAYIEKIDRRLQVKDFNNVEKDLKQLEKLRPGENYINYYWGVYYQKQNKHVEAINYFKIYNKKTKNDPDSYNKIGYCYNQLKKYSEAEKYYKASLEFDSSRASTYNGISWSCFLQKKYKDGIPYTDKCLKLDSTNANYFDTKACLLFGLNDYSESIKYFSKAIVLKPDLINSYIYLARIYIKKNDQINACKNIKLAVNLIKNHSFEYDYEDIKQYQNIHCK